MCQFSKGENVIWTVDNNKYHIVAVHSGGGSGCTYDIAPPGSDTPTETNVPEGNLRVDT